MKCNAVGYSANRCPAIPVWMEEKSGKVTQMEKLQEEQNMSWGKAVHIFPLYPVLVTKRI